MTNKSISEMLDAKDFKAPRITPADVDAVIIEELYFTGADASFAIRGQSTKPLTGDPLALLTFCVLTLKNGFTVTGESACASPENFDAEIGRRIARKNAYEKIWPLEGYLLKQRLYEQNQCTDERMCPGCYSGQADCKNKHFVVLKDGDHFVANNGGELYEYCNHPEFLVAIPAK